MNSFKKSWKYGCHIAIVFVVQHTCCVKSYYAYKKKKTLWPLFMDGVQLLQG